MRRYLSHPVTVMALLVLCLVLTQTADAKVTKAVLSASPAEFRGDCPGVITFTGTITVDAPGKVKYIFTRSDGAIDTITKTLVFKKAGTQKVKTTWTLGGQVLPCYEGWEAIDVTAPNTLTSNQAKFNIKCNPPLNSALSAHGNTDWHINTANEFLFGVDMNGNATAPNHAPDSWTKQHMHVGLSNTAKYYYDKSLTASGMDTDAASGIDRAMLFFYAGHGWPPAWDTLGDSASQTDVKLANIAGKGTLRYYWQCSCEVFAHGPLSSSSCGASMEYSCPQNFDGSHDSAAMRNVFERWGPALSPDLRMACGGSTSMWCWYDNVNAVWDDYNINGMSVAESFIDGFSSSHPGVVPLCITMGGSNITNTPLYTDTTFTNQPNTSGSGYYHIIYLGGGTQTEAKPSMVPLKLPKLIVVAADILPNLKALGASASISQDMFAGKKAIVHIDEASGSVHMKAAMREQGIEARISDTEYLRRADALVKKMKWDNSEMTKPVVTRLMTASMPIDGKTKDATQGQKSVLITYSREIDVNGTKVDVLGAGGKVKILMSNAGNILSANRIWRKIKDRTAGIPLKSFEEAQAEAIKKLPDADAYKLDQWKWGYKEPAGNLRTTEMTVVFQFWFVPKKHEDQRQYPPVFTEIQAEKQ
ncbi:MAG: hypothetical protein LUP94_02220 [Candidatus Methanomethylicus sp.]|nr:hypothetical protein [Candidatus Methanomethylicus sp.]